MLLYPVEASMSESALWGASEVPHGIALSLGAFGSKLITGSFWINAAWRVRRWRGPKSRKIREVRSTAGGKVGKKGHGWGMGGLIKQPLACDAYCNVLKFSCASRLHNRRDCFIANIEHRKE